MQDFETNVDNFNEIAISYNDHLREIEKWDETDLPKYKSKVLDHTFGSFLRIVIGLFAATFIYSAVVGISSMFLSIETIFKMEFQIIAIILINIISFIIFYIGGRKAIRKLINSCHGEIGHDGAPFMRKVKVCFVLAIILYIAAFIVLLLMYNKSPKTDDLGLLNGFMYLSAFIVPLARFLGFITGRKDLPICPICGRYDTVYKQQMGEMFGETHDGSHTETAYQTERVGTRYTTTTYTDGSKNTTSSPIYESVRYTEVYQDYSGLIKYVYLCSECSYCELSLEEKKWKIRTNRYRG